MGALQYLRQMTDDDTNTETEEVSTLEQLSRRRMLASAAGLGLAGAAGISLSGSATADPSGEFPVPSDDPLLKIRADRVRLVGRTSDPSSPDDGTMWYPG